MLQGISYDETMVTSKRQLEAKLGLGFEKRSQQSSVDFIGHKRGGRWLSLPSNRFTTAGVDTQHLSHSVFGPNVTAQDLKDRESTM